MIAEDSRERPMLLPSSQPMKTHSPDVRPTSKHSQKPLYERKMQDYSTNKAPSHPELDGLRRENSELKSRLREFVRTHQQPAIEHQEVVRLRDRIIQQERIIACYRMSNESKDDARAMEEMRKTAKDRERTIQQLKKIIENMPKDNGELIRTNSTNELKDRLKVLTIENDRLGQIVQRLSSQRSRSNHDDAHSDIIDIKTQNERLKLELTLVKVEQPQLKSMQHRLAVQSKEINCLEQKNRLQQQQNITLIKLFKQQSNISEKRKLEEEVNRLNNILKLQQESTEALVSAKEHYTENLRLFQQTVHQQVTKQLNRYEQKFIAIKQKLDRMEKLAIARHAKEQFDSPIVSRFNPAETNKKLLTLTSFEDTRGATRQMKYQTTQPQQKQTVYRRHQGLNATTEHPKVNEEVVRLEAAVDVLQRELHSKDQLCKHQQQMFDQLSHQLQEYRERSLQAINTQFETDRATREKDIDEIRRLHRCQMDTLRTDLENELINVVNINSEKVDSLRDKIHQQNLDLLRLQGENQRLKSELRLARTNPQISEVMMETRGLLEKTSSKISNGGHQLTLQRVTEVISQSDSQPESKFASVACDTYTQTFFSAERPSSDLKVSVQKFKQVMDNLIIQNGMIPQLKNRIQVLQAELLRLEQNVEEVHRRLPN